MAESTPRAGKAKLGLGHLNGSEDKETFNAMSKGPSGQIEGLPVANIMTI